VAAAPGDFVVVWENDEPFGTEVTGQSVRYN
jgi:hypothetical protein